MQGGIEPAPCCPPKRRPALNLTTGSLLVLGLLISLSFFNPFLESFRTSFFTYVGKIAWAVLLGFGIGGVIDYYVPREVISRFLARPRKRTIFISAIMGFLMSTCSHGVLAVAVELYRKGASIASVIAFLLASPWVSLPLTLMLIGFFGFGAAYFIVGAFGVALVTGWFFQRLEERGWVEKNPNTVDVSRDFSIRNELRQRFKSFRFSWKGLGRDGRGILRSSLGLGNMVLGWIVIGIALASLADVAIPSHIFQHFMGSSFRGMMVTLGLATLLEICSEGTAPLAFEIYRETHAFGNAFVFLMAGVVTDLSEIGLLWTNIGWRSALWMPVLSVPLVLLLGFLANQF